MGQAVKKQVNKRYTLLEIEVDGVYKSMLLLKKKKYAAMKVEMLPSGEIKQEMELKGLDIVRRDWCLLSKDCGNFALKRILSGDKEEDVVDSIHAHLKSVRETVHNGQVPMNKFVITKQLTKQPEDYPDAKNQPHVQVALRRKAQGKRNGVAAGETVPYIICIETSKGEENQQQQQQQQQSKSMAERAYHPDEIKGSDSLVVDFDYYLGQQVHPVVSRLCEPISGTDPGHLANCLGLDPTR
jgi:DNA polymerase alpha subunit A